VSNKAPHDRDVGRSMPICMPTRDEWSALRSGRFIPVTERVSIRADVDRNLWPCRKRNHSSSRSLNYLFCTCTVKTEQRQCTYKVTLRSFRPTIPAVEKQWVLHNLSACICSLRYPACNGHAPYFHLLYFPALQYFSTFSQKRHDFIKNVTEHKICDLIFSTTFVWNISHSKYKWVRYDKKCILVFM
jgi:hypothetical protein